MDRSVGRREERGKPASVAVQKRNNKIDTMRLLLAALLPLAAQGFVPVTIGGPNPKTLTRLHFKVPTEPVPVVDTLEKKGNNLTWSLPEAEPLQDKDVFRMPWLAPVKPPRRGWLETSIAASPDVDDGPEAAAEARAAQAELAAVEELEREMGLGEDGPVTFVARLGQAGAGALGNVSWLQPAPAEALAPPEKEGDRAFVYRPPGWVTSFTAAVRRRLQPFPLFRAVPKNCVVVGSVRGDDLNLLTGDGPPSLAKLLQEPPIGWLEPVSPLVKAAHDPRVKALILRIGPLSCGYAKLVEMRRHMDYFKSSGKSLIAYMDSGAEKEYFLALGCDEIYMPPGGALRLQGFVSAANFLRGVFDKVGLEPLVVRIGAYKSAGDTLARQNSTEEFRLVQETLVTQTAEYWVQQVASDLNKTKEEVMSLWDSPISDPMRLAYRRFITASLYYDQVKEMVAARHRARRLPFSWKERPARLFSMRSFLKAVGSGRRILPGLPGVRGPTVAVINAAGEIGPNGAINANDLVDLLEQAEQNPRVKAVVLRIDSPGGDALTSELIWRRILRLRSVKPVVASMVDVAASGGYFLAMGCSAIVAEEATVTGSIGVVAVLFKLRELFSKIGLNEEAFGVGRYSKFFVPGHVLSAEERALFEKDVGQSYQDFVQKAAFCRNLTWEGAHAVAQGRVWRGADAKERGLVDVHGGVWRAVEVAKRLAKIPDKRGVTLRTVRGQRRLFAAGRGGEDEDAYVPSSLSSVSAGGVLEQQGRPLALADDVVGDYLRSIGATAPGLRPWAQGLGVGLLTGLALQGAVEPYLEGLRWIEGAKQRLEGKGGGPPFL